MSVEGIAGLREALVQLVRRPAGAPDAGACLDRIERLAAGLGTAADPQLRHYLANRSYVKALALLEGGTAETRHDPCGGDR